MLDQVLQRELSKAEEFALLPVEEQTAFLDGLSDKEVEYLTFCWEYWARPTQLTPTDRVWDNWLILAGRGFGKTRTGAEWVRANMCGSTPLTGGKWRHIALIGETAADVRDVMVGDGKAPSDPSAGSGILQVHPKDHCPRYFPSKRRLEWPNGAAATLYNAVEPDQLRGPQHDAAWCDELCLVAGTLVDTSNGAIPIEQIQIGDLVWTRLGLRRVLNCGLTKEKAEIWRLITKSGNAIEGTSGHPIFVGNETKPLSMVNPGDVVCLRSSFGERKSGIFTKITTKIAKVSCFIEKNIRTLLAYCLRTLIFITKTATKKTTTYQIWNRFLEATTFYPMSRAVLHHGINLVEAKTPQNMFGERENSKRYSAWSAERNSNPRECAQSSVIQIVDPQTLKKEILTTTVLAVEKTNRLEPVFNLEIEETPEYFANGILVHNCKWRYQKETWDQLQFGMRTGRHPQALISTTPRPTLLLKEIMNDRATYTTVGSTFDNLANLSPSFIKAIKRKYEGTRLGLQELYAQVLDDFEGALWKRTNIDDHRIAITQLPPLKKLTVAIDPNISSEENANECGIICAGIDGNGHGYVIDDASAVLAPDEWARAAINLYKKRRADRIVAEVNQGGEMVENTIRTIDPNVSFIPVHATRGKYVRAEPVSALYEQGRIHHVGHFSVLEDQMCSFTVDFDRKTMGYSPDRMDALVWAFTDLLVEGESRRMSFISM